MIFCYKFTKKRTSSQALRTGKIPAAIKSGEQLPKVRPKALTIRKPVKGRDFINGFTYYFNEKFSKLF